MVMKPTRRAILDEFRSGRGQHTEVKQHEERRERKKNITPHDSFMVKFKNLDADKMEQLTTRDLVYYFREVAFESGYRYMIANIKKDMAIMKRLREDYTNGEICAMIEFLYQSEQDYLDKAHLSPNVLASQWVNTIYPDMQLWVNDEYVPKSQVNTSKRQKSQHEWSSDEKDTSKIGVKL